MIYAFTSAALNYLPKARLCLGSLRRFHPEFRLCYALADRLPPGTTIEESCVDEVIAVEDLPELAAPGWIFQHSIVELSTGIKGAVLQRLLAREDCEAVLYFDPDIVLFSRLDDLLDRLRAPTSFSRRIRLSRRRRVRADHRQRDRQPEVGDLQSRLSRRAQRAGRQ